MIEKVTVLTFKFLVHLSAAELEYAAVLEYATVLEYAYDIDRTEVIVPERILAILDSCLALRLSFTGSLQLDEMRTVITEWQRLPGLFKK